MPDWPHTYPLSFFAPFPAVNSPPALAATSRSTGDADAAQPTPALEKSHERAPSPRPSSSRPHAPSLERDSLAQPIPASSSPSRPRPTPLSFFFDSPSPDDDPDALAAPADGEQPALVQPLRASVLSSLAARRDALVQGGARVFAPHDDGASIPRGQHRGGKKERERRERRREHDETWASQGGEHGGAGASEHGDPSTRWALLPQAPRRDEASTSASGADASASSSSRSSRPAAAGPALALVDQVDADDGERARKRARTGDSGAPSRVPTSPARGRYSSPARRPTSGRLIVEKDLTPNLHGLMYYHYVPFLHENTPIEPMWSASLYRLVVKLLVSIAPPHKWSPDPAALVDGGSKHWVSLKVTSRQPNKAAIRTAVGPLGRTEGFSALPPGSRARFGSMVDVMRWLWDDEALGEPEAAWMVLSAPRAIHILSASRSSSPSSSPSLLLVAPAAQLTRLHLSASPAVRELGGVVRFAQLVQYHEHDLMAHLRRLAAPTAHERAALTLLDWLNTSATPDRHYLFLSGPKGHLRGEETGTVPWKWWFARADSGRSTAVEVLDDWERDTLSMEKW